MKGYDFMKNIKRLMNIITISVMVFCMNAFNVSAESEYKITVKNENTNVSIIGQTFTAYKVFSLTSSGDNYSYTADDTCVSSDYSTVASTISAIDVASILTALNSESNARIFADAVYNTYIKANAMNAEVKKVSATATAETVVIDVGEKGYYLVFGKGTDPNGEAGKNTVTSLVMLNTAAPAVEISTKIDAPSITKEIKHNESNTWGKVGDNQVGDAVEYRFTSTIPSNATKFTAYDYIIHDTMSEGLNFNNDVTVYKDEDKTQQLDSKYITVAKTDNQNFTVKIDILGAISEGALDVSDTLYTYYTATLNTSALIADKASSTQPDSINHNDNEAYLEYSNNPYDITSKGETTRSQVYDWTFTFEVNKVDSKSDPLANAVFNIKKGTDILTFSLKSTNVYVVDTSGTITDITTDSTGKFKILGLDDEVDYTLVEKTPPAGYNRAEDTAFKIKSVYDVGGNSLTSLSATINSTDDKPNAVTVINLSGTELAGTGGIGTTIFFVTGGVLMAVAVVFLITKKRMNK